jgi:hypothetical protein
MPRLLVSTIFCLLTTSLLNAATITVCPSGCNETTITAAIAAATPGDTISVAAGIWYENLSIQKSVTIQGVGSDQTIIDGSATASVVTISDSGSAVEVFLEHLGIRNGSFSGGGGGIRVDSDTRFVSVSVADCEVRENIATGPDTHGGGIYAYGALVSLSISSSSILNNVASYYGGGVYAEFATELSIVGSTISQNNADNGGAVMAVSVGQLRLSNVDVESNTGRTGVGGVSLEQNPDAEIVGCRFVGNSGTLTIGALLVYASTARISQCSFEYNSTSGYAAGLKVTNSAAEIKQSTFHGNTARSAAAMHVSSSSSVSVENTTISGNLTTELDGGGIWNLGSVLLSFSTVAFNQSDTGYGTGIRNEGFMTVEGSILSDNLGNNCGGLYTSYGYNIDDDGSCGFAAEGDVSGISPGLLPAIDYGDYRYYHPIPTDSNAVDAAFVVEPPAVDQRGAPRPMDGDRDSFSYCDIGAFEIADESFGYLFSDDFESGNTSAWSNTVP